MFTFCGGLKMWVNSGAHGIISCRNIPTCLAPHDTLRNSRGMVCINPTHWIVTRGDLEEEVLEEEVLEEEEVPADFKFVPSDIDGGATTVISQRLNPLKQLLILAADDSYSAPIHVVGK